MKTVSKIKMGLLVVVAGLAFSCKKNDAATTNNQYTDSTATETTVDTTEMATDTVGTGTSGTTGTGTVTDSTTAKGK